MYASSNNPGFGRKPILQLRMLLRILLLRMQHRLRPEPKRLSASCFFCLRWYSTTVELTLSANSIYSQYEVCSRFDFAIRVLERMGFSLIVKPCHGNCVYRCHETRTCRSYDMVSQLTVNRFVPKGLPYDMTSIRTVSTIQSQKINTSEYEAYICFCRDRSVCFESVCLRPKGSRLSTTANLQLAAKPTIQPTVSLLACDGISQSLAMLLLRYYSTSPRMIWFDMYTLILFCLE